MRDRFTIRVVLGTMWVQGMGSDGQVDFGEDNISCLISSKDAGLKDENVGGNLSGTE